MMKVIKKKILYGFGLVYCYVYNFNYHIRHYKSHKILKRQLPQDLFFIHSPKTAGQSITNALDLQGVGHHTLQSYNINDGDVEKLLICLRDPIARFQSIYKYSHKPNHRKLSSPLWILPLFKDIDSFVESVLFDCFVKHHYFFRSQFMYVEGLGSFKKTKVVIIRFNHINKDFEKYFSKTLPQINPSPKNELIKNKAILSQSSVEKIKLVYHDDFIFIDEYNLDLFEGNIDII